MTRSIMTRAELATHHIDRHGRDFMRSSDGYDDMEINQRAGWKTLAGWGHDGWDLGNWPYVVISIRNHEGKFQMQQVVEGDHDVYTFDSAEDREAAIDYLFLWYAAETLSIDRAALDEGNLAVDDKYRGPYRRHQ